MEECWPAARKRKREASVDAWEALRSLDIESLFDPTKVTRIPYPGMGDPGARPGREIDVIGIPDLAQIINIWDEDLDDDGGILFVGGNGIGKSVWLRAFACVQFRKAPEDVKIICIWNFGSLMRDTAGTLREALLFAYHNSAAEKAAIANLESVCEIKKFMMDQERQSVRFWFILDGAHALDVRTWYGQREDDASLREQVSNHLEQLLIDRKVLWGVSPAAHQVELDDMNPPENVCRLVCVEGYGKLALRTFTSRSVLGAVVGKSEKRQRDVDRYAGTYPWFLSILDACCIEVATASERKVLLAQGVCKSLSEIRESMSREMAAVLLDDDESWTEVTRAFENHRSIASIRNGLELRLKVTEACHRLEQMIRIDPRYTLSKQKFCTRYMEELYIDTFRAKETDFAKSRSGSWLDYAALVLKEPVICWTEVGWICERVATDVVSRLGIQIHGLDIVRVRSGATKFTVIPDLTSMPLSLGPGYAIVFIPSSYSFGDIDGAVMFMDLDGQLHLVALQFTTNVDKHMHSADNFMSISVVDQWIPSSLDLVSRGEWKLHFAFVCLRSDEREVSKGGTVSQLRRGVHYGVLPYTLHIRTFEDALGHLVPKGELEILRNLVRLREDQHPVSPGCLPFPNLDEGQVVDGQVMDVTAPLRMTPTQLAKMKQAELHAIAISYGINPATYKNMGLLKQDMQDRKFLIVI